MPCAVGDEKVLRAGEITNSTLPCTQSSNEGPKMHNVVLRNTNEFASDLSGYIKAATCVSMCVYICRCVFAGFCVNRAEHNVHLNSASVYNFRAY